MLELTIDLVQVLDGVDHVTIRFSLLLLTESELVRALYQRVVDGGVAGDQLNARAHHRRVVVDDNLSRDHCHA